MVTFLTVPPSPPPRSERNLSGLRLDTTYVGQLLKIKIEKGIHFRSRLAGKYLFPKFPTRAPTLQKSHVSMNPMTQGTQLCSVGRESTPDTVVGLLLFFLFSLSVLLTLSPPLSFIETHFTM